MHTSVNIIHIIIAAIQGLPKKILWFGVDYLIIFEEGK